MKIETHIIIVTIIVFVFTILYLNKVDKNRELENELYDKEREILVLKSKNKRLKKQLNK
ncbi:hypothetical protein [Flavobacterium capsici]|uniref:Uncharacterized protein n=1 Tax=Flavobacterium capsici TaxID=3075618 RepID=A0AA96J2P1_9FLAO|nr:MULTISPECIES: hypothetical protein [unclassified Flavobacterium]WNM19260.1 hypothetical protein RN608_00925 [Flavobacterium sp. PMR2A8]WNM20649.1 hypothetical protein RN605_08095 [Flavobacterium sp. PMTSA4]